jgi:hypothetical protein
MTADTSLPLEHFIQAVQRQLDNAQTAMAVKARNLNMPLTFAIKDISLDLRAHVEFARSEIRIRPAGPGDTQASVFHLVFTAITRPNIEENAIAFEEAPEDETLDVLKDELTEDERRRLEWVGVRTVSKLRELQEAGGGSTVQRVTSLPVDRLRQALARASAPVVEQVTPAPPAADDPPDLANLVRVRGRNLVRDGLPRVSIRGEPVAVVRGGERELLIAPRRDQMSGELVIEPITGRSTAVAFDLSPFWREPKSGSSNGSGEPS